MEIGCLLGMGVEIGAERRLRRERRLPGDVGKGRFVSGCACRYSDISWLTLLMVSVRLEAPHGSAAAAGVAVVVGVAVDVGVSDGVAVAVVVGVAVAASVGVGVGVGVGSPFACGNTTIAVATPHNTAAASEAQRASPDDSSGNGHVSCSSVLGQIAAISTGETIALRRNSPMGPISLAKGAKMRA